MDAPSPRRRVRSASQHKDMGAQTDASGRSSAPNGIRIDVAALFTTVIDPNSQLISSPHHLSLNLSAGMATTLAPKTIGELTDLLWNDTKVKVAGQCSLARSSYSPAPSPLLSIGIQTY